MMSLIRTAAVLRQQIADNIWTDPESGCHLWQAFAQDDKYGQIYLGNRKKRPAHCVAYELENGPIPAGMEIDHLCNNPRCVNPAHLEAVTHAENMRRMSERKTHCKRGHPFDLANTHINIHGARDCRKCRVLRMQAARRRKAERLDRPLNPPSSPDSGAPVEGGWS